MTHPNPSSRPPSSAKILVAGGFGVGKTTLVGAVSEITPLRTEAALTTAGAPVDDTAAVPAKSATTVAMDFGRITVASDLILYLFGTPGQHRFWFMWDELTRGAVGAVILVDTRRLPDSFPAIDYFDHHQLPYLIAVNPFDGAPRHQPGEIREALGIAATTPLVACDARDRDSATQTLICLTEHAIRQHRRSGPRARPGAGRDTTAGGPADAEVYTVPSDGRRTGGPAAVARSASAAPGPVDSALIRAAGKGYA